MYAQLGDTIFQGKLGLAGFSGSSETEYAQHPLIDGKPRLQQVAEKLEEITLSINLHYSFCNPEDEISKLQTARSNGYILPFILGTGTVVGDFVITSIKRDITQTDQLGAIVFVSLIVQLLEYYEVDPVAREQRNAQLQAFAIDITANQMASQSAPAYTSPGNMVTQEVQSTTSESAKIDRNINDAAANPGKIAKASSNITKSINKMNHSVSVLRNALVTTQKLQNLAAEMPARLSILETTLSNLKAQMPITDISQARLASSNVGGAVLGLNNSQSGIAKAVITRKI